MAGHVINTAKKLEDPMPIRDLDQLSYMAGHVINTAKKLEDPMPIRS